MKLDLDKLDFERCEEEPIHIPESIQAYGYFFGLDPDSRILKVYSENSSRLFKQNLELGVTNFFDTLDLNQSDLDFLLDSYLRAKEMNTRLPVEIRFDTNRLQKSNENSYHAVIYHANGLMIFEVEPEVEFVKANSARQYSKIYSANISPKYKSIENIGELASAIVDTVRKLTQFERVVLYKFNPDGSGQVIAESKVDDVDSYLDLHYPASDIPSQARELYKKNGIRLIPDVDLEPAALFPKAKEGGRAPIDLSNSLLRAMSPIHLQYIRNQGLKASMSMSLISHGDLWGLISCHHREKHYLPQNIRIDCEELSKLFSWQLYAKEEEIFNKRKIKTNEIINSFIAQISDQKSIIEIFKENEQQILEMMDCCGFIFKYASQYVTVGEVPSETELQKLTDIKLSKVSDVWSSHRIVEDLEMPQDFSLKGVLYIPLSPKENFYTAWFRKEKIQVQKWAGNPKEKQIYASKKERLKPRTSFKVHEIKVKGESPQWEANDIDIAEKFHKVFLTYALNTQKRMERNISFLEEKDQSKDEFIATLAHELRNPLAPLANASEIIDSMAAPDAVEIRKANLTIQRQLGQLTTLVDDLLDVSRITRRNIKINIEDMGLKDLIDNVAETSEQLIREKNQKLFISLPQEDLIIRGDKHRLTQAVGNVLNNASKYTDENGIINIKCSEKNGQVIIRIEDTGIGIPPEKIDSIFDMFSQVDAKENARGGLGIGLTLTKRLLELNGGSIEASSAGAAKGTSFIISLLKATPSKAKKGVQEQEKQVNVNELKGVKVLLVDDNPEINDTLRILLEKRGMVVQTAYDGKTAIQVYSEFRPKLAVLDIGLPDMTGHELCQKLRDGSKDSQAIFIAQSGWGQEKDKFKSKEVGFYSHLVKPVKTKALVEIFLEALANE